MTIIKRPLDPRRLRSALPRGFGWIDHRFLTEGYLGRLSPHARSLYCLLVCAADSSGLSFYSDQRLRDLLAIDAPTLLAARRELLDLRLIAYSKPLCQVLALNQEEHFAWPLPVKEQPRLASVKTPSRPALASVAPSFPTGLNLRAMVEASLREGGVL